MNLLSFFARRPTAPAARDRLQILLAHERAATGGQPDLVAKLREEILANAADLNGGSAAPNAPQLVRVKELATDTARTVEEFNQLATAIVARINERLQGKQRIEVSPVVP